MSELYRARNSGDDSNMVPMINVVFLLLIFFMIAGQIHQVSSADLVLPTAASEKPAQLSGLRIEMDRENQVWLQGEAISIEQLATHISGMEHSFEVALLIDESVTAQHFDPVLEVFRKVGMARVTLIAQTDTSSHKQVERHALGDSNKTISSPGADK